MTIVRVLAPVVWALDMTVAQLFDIDIFLIIMEVIVR